MAKAVQPKHRSAILCIPKILLLCCNTPFSAHRMLFLAPLAAGRQEGRDPQAGTPRGLRFAARPGSIFVPFPGSAGERSVLPSEVFCPPVFLAAEYKRAIRMTLHRDPVSLLWLLRTDRKGS
ncbi:hypothetical protein C8Q77DRAFT_743807 [Trametes polyzona]|nr:hypothetical protein C8Q77DRAFT_743807 [Trametes polyzona]